MDTFSRSPDGRNRFVLFSTDLICEEEIADSESWEVAKGEDDRDK